MRRALAIASLVAVALIATGCGGTSPRERVDSYIKKANAIELQAAPAFKRANAAYGRFVRGVQTPEGAPRELAAAEKTIRDARGRLAALPAPVQATVLKRRLLHVFDLDLGLAHESTELARYQPAASFVLGPLTRINSDLRNDLQAKKSSSAQARALERYAHRLSVLVGKLRRLHPPPVLVPAHRGEIRQLAATRRLALRLRGAIAKRDAPRVARLLIRFRKLAGAGGEGRSVAARAVRAYQRRYAAIGAAEGALRREQARLARTLK